MSGYCQSCKWELYRSLEVLAVSLGLPVFLPASLAFISKLWCGGNDSGQGNGSDERDDGFVEQHCKECGVKAAVVFLVCV